MATVFVSGATGVLGRATIPQLLASGHTVRALSRGEANDVGVFVYPSFASVYPDRGDAWIDAVSTPVAPTDILLSTLAAEREVARFAESGGRGISLRLWGVFGGG